MKNAFPHIYKNIYRIYTIYNFVKYIFIFLYIIYTFYIYISIPSQGQTWEAVTDGGTPEASANGILKGGDGNKKGKRSKAKASAKAKS